MAARVRANPDAAVTLAGPARRADERLTFDVACRPVLRKISGPPSSCGHTLLLERVQGSVWVTLDTDWIMTVEDISDFQVVTLARKSPFRSAGRPFLLMAPLDRNRLMECQSQARAMADLHRSPQVTAGPAGAAPAVTESRSLTEKRQGAGRDKRLSPLPEVTGMVAILPLFRERSPHHTWPSVPMVSVYAGPSTYDGLSIAVVGSGIEPLAYGMSFFPQFGLTPKGMAVSTVKNKNFTIYLLSLGDRLNASKLATAEHLARWALQIIEAHRNNPKQADYDGLERKQFRLSQEEITSAAKKDKKKDPRGKGEGQDTKEDD